jgi:hypothetical protein
MFHNNFFVMKNYAKAFTALCSVLSYPHAPFLPIAKTDEFKEIDEGEMFWRLTRKCLKGRRCLKAAKTKSVSIESHTGTTKSITHCFFSHYAFFPFFRHCLTIKKNAGKWKFFFSSFCLPRAKE